MLLPNVLLSNSDDLWIGSSEVGYNNMWIYYFLDITPGVDKDQNGATRLTNNQQFFLSPIFYIEIYISSTKETSLRNTTGIYVTPLNTQ